jgi:hypothetical protein
MPWLFDHEAFLAMMRESLSSPVMIRAVLRGIALWLLLGPLVSGDALDEAVRTLANKVSTRLPPAVGVRVTLRNLSSVSEAEAGAIRASLEKALARDASRTAPVVDVTLTISQNIREFLLVTEFQRNGEQVVEMVSYRPDSGAKPARSVLERRLVWEQRNPILDAEIDGDRLLILEAERLSVYTRSGDAWQLAQSKSLDPGPAIRDLRGKIEVSNEAIAVIFPGRVCRSALTPALDLHCDSAEAVFPLAGEMAHFTQGRNTIDAAGLPPSFSIARISETSDSLVLAAQPDGRTHLYDGSKRPVRVIEGWGSDLVSPESGCGAGRVVLVDSAADRGSDDSITAFTLVDRKPSQAGEPAEFGGSITAFWPSRDGAMAVVHNPKAGTYAAYFVTVDCGS